MKNKLSVETKLINGQEELSEAFLIREVVFVKEQKVGQEDEFDEFEKTSRHFLAKIGNDPVGAARWRKTNNGIKMERFAVLKEYRGKGVGESLVKAVLADVNQQESEVKSKCYLHAQIEALPFYKKLGFVPYGEQFDECGIMHQAMSY